MKSGFTLPEVMITLVIVGVVFAITIPVVLNKIEDSQNIAKWKLLYSQIGDAFNSAYEETNHNSLCNGGDCVRYWNDEFIRTFIGKFEVIDECGRYNTNEAGCGSLGMGQTSNFNPDHIWASQHHNITSYKTLAKGSMNAYDFDKVAFLLKNGATVYMGGSHNGPTIMVDVNNAANGPNILGKDLFGIVCLPTNSCTHLVPEGTKGTQCSENQSYCSTMYRGAGSSGCSPDIGAKNADYVFEAAGAGCAFKYLLE